MSQAEKAAAKARREAEKGKTGAKKPRAAKAPKAARPAASSQSSGAEFKKPNPDELLKLVKQVCARAADQKTIGMAAKELIDKAAETRGLDKAAFGIVRKLWKMGQDNPEKLSVTLPHLLSYVDDLGLADIADGARGLEINGEDDSGEDDGQTDIEDAVAETTGAETSDDFYDSAAPAPAHRLSIVPGPNAPSEPDEESNAA
jgi:hypothetical protein